MLERRKHFHPRIVKSPDLVRDPTPGSIASRRSSIGKVNPTAVAPAIRARTAIIIAGEWRE